VKRAQAVNKEKEKCKRKSFIIIFVVFIKEE